MDSGDELPATCDVLVVGGGVVGLALALELARRRPGARIVVLEKEASVGAHASGRNSGVLHAGFYYAADSLKAQLTREGNRRLAAWCDEHGVPIRRTGKLVVARSEAELPRLEELLARGRANGVPVELCTDEEARRIEPRVRTAGRALFSPTTAVVDPLAVMRSLALACRRAGVTLATGTAWLGALGRRARTSRGTIEPGYLVNAAGLHADRVARAYGFGAEYRVVPFKGLYLHGNERAGRLATHVYPVPDAEMPFLGVHFTVAVDGHVKIGPTALPALWLENYGALGRRGFFAGFSLGELARVLVRDARLLLADPAVRRHAWRELAKSSRRALVRHAAALVRGTLPEHFDRWGASGIRAQLYDARRGRLVMDFLYEGDDRSMHVLNAISPAFTCALSFAEHLADAIERAGG
jgi:L-2-hydroxyglutarate oxidase LhgO